MSALYDLFLEQLKDYDLGALSKEKREQRIATCQSCDEFKAENTSCNLCRCNVNWKVMLGQNSCMKGKWVGEQEAPQ